MPDNSSALVLQIASGTSGSSPLAEVPFNADIADVTAVVPANVGTTACVVDLLKNGASLFPVTLGNVAKSGATAQGASTGISASGTTLNLEYAGNGAPSIQVGAQLQIESEVVTVSAQPTGSSGVGTAGAPVYAVPVTRAQNGTSAAAHAGGTAVTLVKPTIAIGAQKSSLGFNFPYGPTPLITEGDTLQASMTIGAAQAVSVTVELVER